MGAIEEAERSRNITAPARDPAEVVFDFGECEIEVELGIEASGREQITLRSPKRAAIPVHQPSVVECPSLPEPIARTAKDREGRAVAGKRLVEPVMVMQENRALKLEPRRRQPVQCGAGEVDFPERARRVSRVQERAAEAHARLGRADDELRLLGGPHRAPELTNGRLPVLQLER